MMDITKYSKRQINIHDTHNYRMECMYVSMHQIHVFIHNMPVL